MKKNLLALLLLITGTSCIGQLDSTNTEVKNKKAYSNELLPSIGYDYCTRSFIDIGVRYYHLKNDAQALVSFSGIAVGSEISLSEKEQVFIPYIGWQGQHAFMAYGLRAEYGFSRKNQAFGLSPEIGLSFIELLRITAGYRLVIENNDPLELSGFRFSVIAAFPWIFTKKES